MVRGGAILHALVLSLVISLLASSILIYSQLMRQRTESLKMGLNLLDNARSGFVLGQALPQSTDQVVDLFNNGNDSAKITTTPWGLYNVVTSTAFHHGDSITISGITGGVIPKNDVALYLPENNRPLSVCGQTGITGNVMLPKRGVQTVHIEGQSFSGNKAVDGQIMASQTSLPELSDQVLNRLAGIHHLQVDARVLDNFIGDSLEVSFDEPPVILSGIDQMKDVVLTGHIVINSNNPINISSSAVLQDVVVIAPEIIVESGFSGSCQLFAIKRIEIGEGCVFNYPSVIAVNTKSAEKSETVILGKESIFNGIVLSVDEKQLSVITIDEGSIVQGQVYVNSRLQHKGTVLGSVYCYRLWLETPSATYENHLLNAKIDLIERSPYYAGLALFAEDSGKEVLKWLQ